MVDKLFVLRPFVNNRANLIQEYPAVPSLWLTNVISRWSRQAVRPSDTPETDPTVAITERLSLQTAGQRCAHTTEEEPEQKERDWTYPVREDTILNWTELNWTQLFHSDRQDTVLNWTELNTALPFWSRRHRLELNWTKHGSSILILKIPSWTELNWTEQNTVLPFGARGHHLELN